jgi:integrase
MYRIVLLRGLRRGEACGLRWQDIDFDAGTASIVQTVLYFDRTIVFDTPKSRSGSRVVSLDAETVGLLRAHLAAQRREQFAAGAAYESNDLRFPGDNGRPLPPWQVSERFKELAKKAGLPVIKLHEARHTAATLGLEAGLDVKIVSVQLGHSGTAITRDLYQHVRRAVHEAAAEKVVALVPVRRNARQARS